MDALFAAAAAADPFMPHGACYLWRQDLVWLHVASDALTTLAYWAIPPFLIYMAVRARRELYPDTAWAEEEGVYRWMAVAFGVFILACGATHAMGIWTIWEPRYWLEGGIKAVTAAASVATAIALPPLVPRALRLIREASRSEARRIELAEANEQLKEFDRLKTKFFANVSHELRTPLSLILGPTEQLLETEGIGEEGREKLRTVRRNARSLLGMVDDLLEVARLEAGTQELKPREVDLAELVRRHAADFESLAADRDQRLTVETPDSLEAVVDSDKCERILTNLLSNALKFTPPEGRIRCTLRSDSGGAVLEVADAGPGVPEHLREAVFERFRQGDGGSEREEGGTGLGLAIVAEFVALHGGDVSVSEAPEGGALFRVELPVSVPGGESDEADLAPPQRTSEGEDGEAQPRGVPGPAGDGDGLPRVLVVEDNADMAAHLADILSDGHRVHVAGDGEEGLARALELEPDVIVTDVMMPRMDGERMLQELRARPGTRAVPVIVLTAKADEELPARMLERGAQDYVVKPVRAAELRARVRNLLSLTRTRRVLQSELGVGEVDVAALAEEAAARKRDLERAVREKEVLLRELHHRVRGNLQTVASLLNLQLRNADEAARGALEESRGRISTMALLHEELYREEDPAGVDLGEYLERLVDTVVRSHEAPGGGVDARVEAESVRLGVEQAVACGLIVHELVVNALRHAFPGDRSGSVTVELRETGGGHTRLAVADEGVGFPVAGSDTGADAGRSGVGLQLVRDLVRQIEGEAKLESGEEGSMFTVTFPIGEDAS